MDTPIKREADILSDDISERHGLQEPRNDGKITTADLAGTRRDIANEVTAEPFREPAPFDDTLRSEDNGNDKGGVVAPTSAPAMRGGRWRALIEKIPMILPSSLNDHGDPRGLPASPPVMRPCRLAKATHDGRGAPDAPVAAAVGWPRS